MHDSANQNFNRGPETAISNEKLLVIFLVITLGSQITTNIIYTMVPDWYESPLRYFLSLIWIISGFSYLLLPFTISNRNLRNIALVIASIIAAILFIQNINGYII